MSVGKKEKQTKIKVECQESPFAYYKVFHKPKAKSSLQIGMNTITS